MGELFVWGAGLLNPEKVTTPAPALYVCQRGDNNVLLTTANTLCTWSNSEAMIDEVPHAEAIRGFTDKSNISFVTCSSRSIGTNHRPPVSLCALSLYLAR